MKTIRVIGTGGCALRSIARQIRVNPWCDRSIVRGIEAPAMGFMMEGLSEEGDGCLRHGDAACVHRPKRTDAERRIDCARALLEGKTVARGEHSGRNFTVRGGVARW